MGCELDESKDLSIVPLQGPGEPTNSLSAGKLKVPLGFHRGALGARAVLSGLSSPPCTREDPLLNVLHGKASGKIFKRCFCFYFQKKRKKFLNLRYRRKVLN